MKNLITRTNGDPFATEGNAKCARTWKGLTHTHEVIQHGGGWVLREKQSGAEQDGSAVTLQPGDYIATEGLSEDDYHAVAEAFMAAGAGKGEYPSDGQFYPYFGWREKIDNLYHGYNGSGWGERQLTLSQIMNATNAGGAADKQDNDGWIENTGTCPVERGARIDVRYRDGVENIGVMALLTGGEAEGSNSERTAVTFAIIDSDSRITHYRLRQDSETKTEHTTETTTEEKPMPQQHLADQLESALAALEHAQSEVNRLQAEYRAAYPKINREVVLTEDMTDPANWRAGDVVTSGESNTDIEAGGNYELIADPHWNGHKWIIQFADNAGDARQRPACSYAFYSRP